MGKRHYVDIFIPSRNSWIEVKSDWTIKEEDVLLHNESLKMMDINAKFGYIIEKAFRLKKHE